MGRNQRLKRNKFESVRRQAEKQFPLLQGFRDKMHGIVKPLFKHRNWAGEPELIGSGVLIAFDNLVFLLTAAHVLEHFDGHEIHMPVAGKLVGVKGHSYRSLKPRTGTHDHDPIDSAVVCVDPGIVRDQLRPDCLTLDDLYMQNEHLQFSLVVLGHPLNTFTKCGNTLDTELCWAEVSGERPEVYKRLGFSVENHILMRYSKRVHGIRGYIPTPSLRGMSGGGVWVVPEIIRRPWPTGTLLTRPRLIGIFIEERPRSKIYIATSIFFHIASISRHHPEVQRMFEQVLIDAETKALQRKYPTYFDYFAKGQQLPEFVIDEDVSNWVVMHTPGRVIMNVYRDSAESLCIYRCEVAMVGPGSKITFSQLAQIKAEAILRVDQFIQQNGDL